MNCNSRFLILRNRPSSRRSLPNRSDLRSQIKIYNRTSLSRSFLMTTVRKNGAALGRSSDKQVGGHGVPDTDKARVLIFSVRCGASPRS